MSKTDSVRKAMMDAMKAGDKERKDALSLLLSALKKKQIDKRSELTEVEENEAVYKEIKETQETLDSTPASRPDILEECRKKIAVYSEFAPALMNEGEIKAVIAGVMEQLGIEKPEAKDKGRIMKALMPLVKGKADGTLVNKLVGELF
jgi:uncharacterized protein YqeY